MIRKRREYKKKIPELLEKLKTGTLTEKQEALKLIGASKDNRAVQPLIDILDNPDNFKDFTPMNALYYVVLGCKDDPKFQQYEKNILIEKLKNRQKEKNEDNSSFLYLLDDTEDAFPIFQEQLKKGDWHCINTFYINNFDGSNYVEEKAKPILLEALKMSPTVAVKSANALMTLKDFKKRSDLVDPVFETMKTFIWDQNNDRHVRNDALVVLWKIRDSRSKDEVEKLSKTENNKILKHTLHTMLNQWENPRIK